MLLFWLFVCIIFTVTAKPLDEDEIHVNGENGWYLPLSDGSVKWVDMKTIEAVESYYEALEINNNAVDYATPIFIEPDINETRINGVNGWYLPFADGSLKWMDMETIERVQKYEKEIINSVNPVKFWLYTAQSSNDAEEISFNATKKLAFNPEHPTIIFAQSFLRNKLALNLNITLKNAFSKKGNYNFISIEWLSEFDFNYVGACCQVPIVGELAAKAFEMLARNHKMDCEKTHLIGYGLGAHVVGFTAKNIKSCKVPKITALDSALALFPYDQPEKRLNSTDARYVESIQTDGGFFGHNEPVGTASFYCSSGKKQPGCKNNVCNHERSVKIFEEAVQKNNFPSNKCDNYASAVNDKCSEQYSEVRLGDDNNDLVARGVYFVKTNDKSPYGTP